MADDLRELLDAIDMEAYLSREGIDYTLKRGARGPQLNVRECPVCGSDEEKVFLNAETGLGNCFAGRHPMGENFNKFRFIKAHLGSSAIGPLLDHLRQVAREQGWHPPRRSVVAVSDLAKLTLPESHSIPVAGRNPAYLENRGISGEVAQYFRLRLSVRGIFPFVFEGTRYIQDYSKRIIIPVYNLDGVLASFQGRDMTGRHEKKYLFPPGYAATGAFLYNGQSVLGTKRVAIGEGAFDAIALKLAFDKDPALRDVVPVATFGKHLSYGDEQSQVAQFARLKVERGVEEVTFFWDGEVAATDAAIEAGNRLREIGIRVRIALLPDDCDPNEVTPSVIHRAFYEAPALTSMSAITLKMARRKSSKAI